MNERHRPGPGPEDLVDDALQLLSARAWPGPDRNHRVEEFIMNGTNAGRATRRKLWVGGLLLLLAGTAIGAVTTTLVTYRFTGVAVDADGNRYDVEGELQLEETGEHRHATITLENMPDGPMQSGELRLEDGRVFQMVPADGGVSVTIPPDAAKPAPEKK